MHSIPGVKYPRHTPAMWFDGLDDYVVADAPIELFGDCALTLSAWIYLEQLSSLYGVYFVNRASLPGETAGIMVDASRIYAQYRGAFYAYALQALDRQTWYHVAISKPSGVCALTQFFLNGAEIPLFDASFTIPSLNNSTPPEIGQYLGGYRFPGIIRACLAYNRVLSAVEIQQIAADRGAYPRSGLIDARPGNGIASENWGGATIYGNPERCRVHRRGTVIL